MKISLLLLFTIVPFLQSVAQTSMTQIEDQNFVTGLPAQYSYYSKRLQIDIYKGQVAFYWQGAATSYHYFTGNSVATSTIKAGGSAIPHDIAFISDNRILVAYNPSSNNPNGYSKVLVWNTSGTAWTFDGTLSTLFDDTEVDILVDHGSLDFYVAKNQQIFRYNFNQRTNNEYDLLNTIGSGGTGNGQFTQIVDFTIIPNTNNLLVLERLSGTQQNLGRLHTFQPNGTLITTESLYQTQTGTNPFPRPRKGIAYDKKGRLYYARTTASSEDRVMVFDPTTTPRKQLLYDVAVEAGVGQTIQDMDIDSTNNRVYLTMQAGSTDPQYVRVFTILNTKPEVNNVSNKTISSNSYSTQNGWYANSPANVVAITSTNFSFSDTDGDVLKQIRIRAEHQQAGSGNVEGYLFKDDNNDNLLSGSESSTSDGSLTFSAADLTQQKIKYYTEGLRLKKGIRTDTLFISVNDGVEFSSEKPLYINYFDTTYYHSVTNTTNNAAWALVGSNHSTTTTYSTLFKNHWTQGAVGSKAPNAQPNIYTYNPIQKQFEAVTDLSQNLTRGKGVALYHFEQSVLGNTNSHSPNILVGDGIDDTSFSFPVESVTIGGGQFDGYQLLANPFPYPIYWKNTNWARVAVNPVVVAWRVESSTAGKDGIYRSFDFNSRSGDLTDGRIEAGEAFWIRTTNVNPTLSVTSDASINNGTVTVASKESINSFSVRLTLHADEAEIGNTYIRSGQDASIDYDVYDFSVPTITSEELSGVYTLANNFKLIHNVVPDHLYEIEIPLYLAIPSPKSEIKLSISDYTGAGEVFLMKNGEIVSSTAVSVENTDGWGLKIKSLQATSNDNDQYLPTSIDFSSYPNPFNPTTTLSINLPQSDNVTIEIFDLSGKRVASILNNSILSAGNHKISVNASSWASGVYVAKIEGKNVGILTYKLTLVK